MKNLIVEMSMVEWATLCSFEQSVVLFRKSLLKNVVRQPLSDLMSQMLREIFWIQLSRFSIESIH